MLEDVNLGLAGYGTVGTGLVRIVEENQDWIARRIGRAIRVRTVLVRDLSKPRGYTPSPQTRFTVRMDDLLEDPDIHIVVELMGGIEQAKQLITRALEAGKHVVTANKALLAEHGPELFELASRKGLGLYYEASVAGGIPVVQTLKESLAGNRIGSITAILNGTANYILTEMTHADLDFSEALAQAQAQGFAEADPTLDIEGFDAAHKLVLLIRLALGVDFPLGRLHVKGITQITSLDIEMAATFGYRIKLFGQMRETKGGIEAGVWPTLVREDHVLAGVDGPFNAILVEGNASGQIMLYGRGAGDMPTGSAVIADVMALCRDGHKPNNTGFGDSPLPEAQVHPFEATSSRYYFRFTVIDRPGVLSVVSGVMGKRGISIAQAVQMGNELGRTVPIVFLTHEAQEAHVRAALEEIDQLDFVSAPTVSLRIF